MQNSEHSPSQVASMREWNATTQWAVLTHFASSLDELPDPKQQIEHWRVRKRFANARTLSVALRGSVAQRARELRRTACSTHHHFPFAGFNVSPYDIVRIRYESALSRLRARYGLALRKSRAYAAVWRFNGVALHVSTSGRSKRHARDHRVQPCASNAAAVGKHKSHKSRP